MDAEDTFFTTYQKHMKAGKSPAEARALATKESGTTPKKSWMSNLARAKATTKAEMTEKPKTWVGKLKEDVKKEQKKSAVTIAEQEDELLRKNVSAADYARLKGK